MEYKDNIEFSTKMRPMQISQFGAYQIREMFDNDVRRQRMEPGYTSPGPNCVKQLVDLTTPARDVLNVQLESPHIRDVSVVIDGRPLHIIERDVMADGIEYTVRVYCKTAHALTLEPAIIIPNGVTLPAAAANKLHLLSFTGAGFRKLLKSIATYDVVI